MSDDWAVFIETPPSFSQEATPIDFNSPLQFGNDDEPLTDFGGGGLPGLVPANPQVPFTLAPNEMECRVLVIEGLPVGFDERTLSRLVKCPNGVRSFEQDQQTGVVTIEFYDLRDAQEYRVTFNGATFDCDPITVRYGAARKTTGSNKPANNGTVVLFRLPPSLTPAQLADVFGTFGEIRQIRSTPSKPYQRFIEFWDTRCAEAALANMSGKIVGGSKISIEFSVPGGMRRQNLQ